MAAKRVSSVVSLHADRKQQKKHRWLRCDAWLLHSAIINIHTYKYTNSRNASKCPVSGKLCTWSYYQLCSHTHCWTLLDGRHEGVGPVKDRVYCRYSGGGDLTGTLHVSELRFASSPPPTSHAASKSRVDILVPAYLRLPWKLPLNEVCACVILHMLQGYLPFSSTLSSTLQHDTVSQQRINHWPVNCTRNRDALLNDWRRWNWHRSCTDLVPADRRTNTSRTSPAAQTLASSPPSNKHSKLPFENTSYRNLQTGHENRHII